VGSGGYGAPASAGGGPGSGGYGAGNVVSIRGHAYSPATLTVAPGTTVRWVNYDKDPHTATGQGFDVELPAGGQGTHTFANVGTFDVKCKYHPEMAGKIVVQPMRAGATGALPAGGAYGASTAYGTTTGSYGTVGTRSALVAPGTTYGTTYGTTTYSYGTTSAQPGYAYATPYGATYSTYPPQTYSAYPRYVAPYRYPVYYRPYRGGGLFGRGGFLGTGLFR
jgi:plastocyanin